MAQLKRYNGNDWDRIGGSIAPKTTQTTSDTDTYSCNYINNLVNIIYPVGSIYMSVNSTNPGTLFGGTWEQLEDRFLLGAGSNYTAGTTGGNMKSLMESLGVTSSQYGGITSGGNYSARMVGTVATIQNDMTFMKPLANFGFDGLPPYLVVYMWKRTA